MHFDKTSPKTATHKCKKIPQRNEKNSTIVRENRPTGNTEGGLLFLLWTVAYIGNIV